MFSQLIWQIDPLVCHFLFYPSFSIFRIFLIKLSSSKSTSLWPFGELDIWQIDFQHVGLLLLSSTNISWVPMMCWPWLWLYCEDKTDRVLLSNFPFQWRRPTINKRWTAVKKIEQVVRIDSATVLGQGVAILDKVVRESFWKARMLSSGDCLCWDRSWKTS